MFRVALILSSLVFCSVAGASPELRDLEMNISVNPNDGGLHLERAELLMTLGRFDEALVACDAAATLKKKDPDVALTRGRIYYAMGELGLAEHHLSKHLRSKRPSAEAFLLRAKIREKTGRFEEAIQDYESARLLGALAAR